MTFARILIASIPSPFCDAEMFIAAIPGYVTLLKCKNEERRQEETHVRGAERGGGGKSKKNGIKLCIRLMWDAQRALYDRITRSLSRSSPCSLRRMDLTTINYNRFFVCASWVPSGFYDSESHFVRFEILSFRSNHVRRSAAYSTTLFK